MTLDHSRREIPDRPSNTPSLSVIVLNWNGRHHLDACLTSLRNQTYGDFEIVLVDNGSTDGSVEHVRVAFPEIRIVALEQNVGFCAGNNAGIRVARGDVIVLLNNDTEADPCWLGALARTLRTHSGGTFCASRVRRFADRTRLDTVGDHVTLAGRSIKLGEGKQDAGKFDRRAHVFTASACAAAYPRMVLERVGLFDERFFFNKEDVDLGFRAQLQGFDCVYVPDAIVYHKVGATGKVKGDWTTYVTQRNLEWVFWKNMPGPLLPLALPLHVAYVGISLIRRTLEGKGPVAFRAKLDALRELRSVLIARREVQARRSVGSLLLLYRLLRARRPCTHT